MGNQVHFKNIRNITVSGRIGSGATTLAKELAKVLKWKMLDGGSLFRKFAKEQGLSIINSNGRSDQFDLEYEERVKKTLSEESSHIIQSHLAGFDGQAIEGVFKILLVCEDEQGEDKMDIRIDRLVNRDKVSIQYAKHEVHEREQQNLEKWRRLYVNNDLNWIYWDKRYYDLVINTYNHNQQETLKIALEAIGFEAK